MFESVNIPHLQTDDSLITFYCVRRMPNNGRLAFAKTCISIDVFDCASKDTAAKCGELVYLDLKTALKLLVKDPVK